MKLVVDVLRPAHIDIVRKVGVGTEQPATICAICPGIEMNGLCNRVNAGIGSTSAGCLDRFVRYFRQRVFND